MMKTSFLLMPVLLLAACSSSLGQPSATPTTTSEPPTERPTAEPTSEPSATPRPDYRTMSVSAVMAIYEPELTFEWNGEDGWIGFDDLECNGIGLYTVSEDPNASVELLNLWLRQEHIAFGEHACDTRQRAAFARDEITRWATREVAIWAVAKLDDAYEGGPLEETNDVGHSICYAKDDTFHLIFLHCDDWQN